MVLSARTLLINNGFKYFIWTTWLTINVVLFYYTFMYYYTGPQFYYLHQMLGYGLCISRASASCINLNSSVLLLPMCKRLITYLRGMKCFVGRQFRRMLDKGRSFHMLCGHLVCLLAVVHCGAHAYNAVYFSKYYNPKYKELNVAKYADQNPLLMLVTSLAGVTGLLLVISLIIIVIFASRPLRKQHNRFWTTHHLFIFYYALLFIHAMDGVIKYQTNLHEHTPGCYLVVHLNSSTDPENTIIFPEPEPHGEPYPLPEGMAPMTNMKMKHRRDVESESHRNSFDTKSSMENNEQNINRTRSEKQPSMSKPLIGDLFLHPVVIPEPEPIPHDGNKDTSKDVLNGMLHYDQLLINGSWVHVKQCDQPRAKFHACPKEVWKWLCVPLLLYVIERAMRFFHATQILTTIEEFKLHSNDVIELKLSRKNFKAKPGQSIWVRCPLISHVELHPFSLTSVPCERDPTFGIHIQVRGDWTGKLRDQLIDGRNQEILQLADEPDLEMTRILNQNEQQYLQVACSREDTISQMIPDRTTETCLGKEHFKSLTGEKNNETDTGKVKANITSSSSKENNTAPGQISTVLNSNFPSKNSFNKVVSAASLKDAADTGRNRKFDGRLDLHQRYPDLYIEGPVGSAMEDLYKYKISLCVAGGIGVTPFASVLNSYLKDSSLLRTLKLRRLYLIWSCRSLKSFEWFANLIEDLQTKLWENNLPDFLNVHLFITGVDLNTLESNVSNRLLPPSILRRCRLNFCRPNMKEVITDICSRHSKCTVGVFCCGPHGLLSSVRKSCMKPPGKTSIKFVFNKESF